jgi:hypothetical protein
MEFFSVMDSAFASESFEYRAVSEELVVVLLIAGGEGSKGWMANEVSQWWLEEGAR